MTLTHSGASELAQLIYGTTAGALIPEIVRRGFQDLLGASFRPLSALMPPYAVVMAYTGAPDKESRKLDPIAAK
jgi:hypothetical protein